MAPTPDDIGAKRRDDIRVLGQQVVDLERRDLVAAARDDVFGASDKLDVSACRQAREIAGLEVSRVERGLRQFRIIQVAEHAERGADLQLAVRCEPKRDAIGRHPDGAEAVRLIGGRIEVSPDNRDFSSLIDPWPPCASGAG